MEKIGKIERSSRFGYNSSRCITGRMHLNYNLMMGGGVFKTHRHDQKHLSEHTEL